MVALRGYVLAGFGEVVGVSGVGVDERLELITAFEADIHFFVVLVAFVHDFKDYTVDKHVVFREETVVAHFVVI